MVCPIDNAPLVMSDRHGIEIDYCPTCRGLWLDRGELDKIIERGAAQSATTQHAGRSPHAHSEDGSTGSYKKTKRENFLSDLFDF